MIAISDKIVIAFAASAVAAFVIVFILSPQAERKLSSMRTTARSMRRKSPLNCASRSEFGRQDLSSYQILFIFGFSPSSSRARVLLRRTASTITTPSGRDQRSAQAGRKAGSNGDPGTAKTSRPCSAASHAVMSDPERASSRAFRRCHHHRHQDNAAHTSNPNARNSDGRSGGQIRAIFLSEANPRRNLRVV